ncbi:MAG: radical SAM/SPASM domain-containing protein [Phycisphaerae bacterium]
MKTIAAIFADLTTSTLGTASRLNTPLKGVPVLRRTVDRLRQVNSLASIHVGCSKEHHQTCSAILDSSGAVVHVVNLPPPPWRELVSSARKWAINGWRGGVGGTTHFDEFVDARWLAPLMNTIEAEAVVTVHAGAALVDPALTERMIRHLQHAEEMARMVFGQSPPGLMGLAMGRPIVEELAAQQTPIGWVFSFKPDAPAKDLITQPPCLEVPGVVRYAAGRLVSDTRRGFERMDRILDHFENPTGEQIARHLLDETTHHVDQLPREIEVELTTDSPLPNCKLHPTGANAGRTSPLPTHCVETLATQLADFDDSLILLGGFGDPLRHADFQTCLSALGGRAFGVAIRTTGLDLNEELIADLTDQGVDLLQVTLDACSPDTYRKVHGLAGSEHNPLDALLANIDKINVRRETAKSIRPILVPSFSKSILNIEEMDQFHDDWLRKAGAVSLHGASTYADTWDDLRVTSMAPPQRKPCARLWNRCIVLADGNVVLCDQDVAGRQTIGSLHEQSLSEIWESAAFNRARSAHQDGSLSGLPLCASCDEWHRP